MQKKIAVSVAFSLAVIFAGCEGGNTSVASQQESVTHSSNTIYTSITNDKNLKNIVIKAAKEKGWRTTLLGEKTIIAEKFDSDTPKGTTIKVGEGVVHFDNMEGTNDSDIVDLKEYIEDLSHAKGEY